MPILVEQQVLREFPALEDGIKFIEATILSENVIHVAEQIRCQARETDLAVFYLGRQSYRPVWELQKRLHAWRVAGKIPDVALLLEHEPVYTLGKSADERHLLPGRPVDARVVATDRGGDVTYHGPGQLVGYPIVNLKEHRPSISWYMRGLEEVIIRTLATYGLPGGRIPGLPGVWVKRRKVAALGVRLARWTTMHGFALNICVPQRYFDGMIPCGILEYGIANLNECLHVPTDVLGVARRLAPLLQNFLGGGHLQVQPVNRKPAA